MIRSISAAVLAAARSPRRPWRRPRGSTISLSATSTKNSSRSTPPCRPGAAPRRPKRRHGAEGRGFADEDLKIIASHDRPKDGNLIATLKGSDTKSKPILLLAHIDVVEANRRQTGSAIPSSWWRRTASSTPVAPRDDKAQGRRLDRHPGPVQAGGLQAPSYDPHGPDLRRGTPDTFNGVQYLHPEQSRPDRTPPSS